jgi:hypothetical protein
MVEKRSCIGVGLGIVHTAPMIKIGHSNMHFAASMYQVVAILYCRVTSAR